MSMLDRNSKQKKVSPDRPRVQQQTATDRTTTTTANTARTNNIFTATDRKNLKINPDDLEKLKTISRFEDKKLYEIQTEIINFFIEHKYEDRDKRIIKRLLNNE